MLIYRILRVGKTDIFYNQNHYLARELITLDHGNHQERFTRGEYKGYVTFVNDIEDEDGKVQFEAGDRIFFLSIFLTIQPIDQQ